MLLRFISLQSNITYIKIIIIISSKFSFSNNLSQHSISCKWIVPISNTFYMSIIMITYLITILWRLFEIFKPSSSHWSWYFQNLPLAKLGCQTQACKSWPLGEPSEWQSGQCAPNGVRGSLRSVSSAVSRLSNTFSAGIASERSIEGFYDLLRSYSQIKVLSGAIMIY